ncbi:class I SAM-dependent DNA methyltransferase [Paenalcaligenes faecalis]|uniref:class I SAM-dependent DNA methyltransferase n=1 Tax=Paenalcaligenes faecalis TaxID=2980099 RepID=UPI0022B94D40|nr:DNA methyltransferase [Paenalcaligenes faecalis]
MAVSQASIIQSLENLVSDLNQNEFIFSFLDAYGFPKSTITRLRKEGDSRNVAENGDIGLRKQLYFRALAQSEDLNAQLEALCDSSVVARNDIRFVLVTDFKNLLAVDLKAQERLDIEIQELDKNYAFFLPLAGYEKAVMYSEHPADLKASEKMGQLFDLIRERNELTNNEDIHALNVFLTRLLFCFYAEDTGIFEEGQFSYALESYTKEDGSDLDQFFSDLFTVLDLEENAAERKKMPAHFQSFKYVNGDLFSADEPIPEFSRKARRILLDCARLNWSEINPDIFGSMFQAVIDEEQRGNLGQHYTSVSNIMKVIQPLFLDDLYAELEKAKGNEKKLKALLVRLQNLSIFDPACGSGNFLIIAYKELRRLEMQIIDALNAASQQTVMYYSGIKLSQFYGIEIDDFACEIATLSLWLAEHQMNTEFKAKFGYAEAALPLKDGGNVVCGNSLRLDWEEVCPPVDEQGEEREVYICGNPPFLGSGGRSKEQNEDMDSVFSGFKSFGMLDFVACWFWKAAQYIQDKQAQFALVATNSICQGEQVAILWPRILEKNLAIRFAYPTFAWKNQAKQNAAVHVVVIGVANSTDIQEKTLFRVGKDEVTFKVEAKNISPYLLEGGDTLVSSRGKPICQASEMVYGNKPVDGGHLLLTTAEKDQLLVSEPQAAKWIKRLLGAQEFINGKERWCLWLVDATKEEVEAMPLVQQRVEAVRATRLASRDAGARKLAERPHQFRDLKNPSSYILVPRVSSERRPYVPIGFLSADVISSDANQMIPNATLYEFGILTSEMHNDWMRTVAGRLKSDYRYSATLVYNTFPWPDVTEPKRKHIESLAEEILLIREDYPDKTLAQLYDPDTMPEPLLQAHKNLDRAVEALYREKPSRDASERLEHLFARYEKLIAAEKEQALAKKKKGSKS